MREFRLVEQFQQYGEVELAGSYRWDLMMRRDLDFYVINPATDLDLALEVLNGFVRQGEFLRFGFIESVRGKPWQTTPESYPTGYYLGMAREFGEGDWKVRNVVHAHSLPAPGLAPEADDRGITADDPPPQTPAELRAPPL